MTLEFSAPRELHNRNAGENGATLRKLLQDGGPRRDQAGDRHGSGRSSGATAPPCSRRPMSISLPTTITREP